MTRDEQLDLITRKCLDANPDLKHRTPRGFRDGPSRYPIRLADVLLAWHKKSAVDMAQGYVRASHQSMYGKIAIEWDLRNDDLTAQSQECIVVLADLLA